MQFEQSGMNPAGRPRSSFVTVIAFIASVSFGAATTSAAPLLSFTDLDPFSGIGAALEDTRANWAVQWTQAVPSTNVTLRAIIYSNVERTANWWVTTAIGPGTTVADVVASGTYTTPQLPEQHADFNPLPRTTLGTGLNFAAGSYYLVLDGPFVAFPLNAEWVGGSASGVTVNLAPGFSLGDYWGSLSPAPFGPGSTFSGGPFQVQFVFELEGVDTTVPEPGTVAMLAAGLGCLGVKLRRRPRPLGVAVTSRLNGLGA